MKKLRSFKKSFYGPLCLILVVSSLTFLIQLWKVLSFFLMQDLFEKGYTSSRTFIFLMRINTMPKENTFYHFLKLQ